MLDKYNRIKNKFDEGDSIINSAVTNIEKATAEMKKQNDDLINNVSNINIIISDIDKQFSEKTGIANVKDMSFLWGAVAIQCVRWLLIENIDEKTLTPDPSNRKDSGSEGKKDKTQTGKQLDKSRSEWEKQKYPNCKSMIILPVPYDAMIGTEDIVIPGVTKFGVNISGTNHHSATFGHDTILGQVVGTANILTRTITFKDPLITTRKVYIPSGREQIVLKDVYTKPMFLEDILKSLTDNENKGINENISNRIDINIAKKLATALIKENLHLQSDKYTKKGLPIPLLTPQLQQQLLNMNWNTAELERLIKGSIKGIACNFAIAELINTIVGLLHSFCYNPKKDEDLKLYRVRTSKVVATSNVISSIINLSVVAGGTITGICSENPDFVKKSIAHLDVGGYIASIHSVCESKKIQEQIRREFLEKELFKELSQYEYNFLGE